MVVAATIKISQSIIFPPRLFFSDHLSPFVQSCLRIILFPRVSEKHCLRKIILKNGSEDDFVEYISAREHCAPRIKMTRKNLCLFFSVNIIARPPPYNIASAYISLFPSRKNEEIFPNRQSIACTHISSRSIFAYVTICSVSYGYFGEKDI